MDLINVENLSFAYDAKVVLENVNFSLKSGDFLCVVGKNGSGKSTLIKGILNLKKQTAGSICFHQSLQKNQIGYMPQQKNHQSNFPATVQEIVSSGYLNKIKFKPFFSKKDKQIIYENMEKLGILDLAKNSFNELSGGQQQRVFLARALCATSKLLVLDEPTNALDPVATKEFYSILNHINANLKITIIMVSHSLNKLINCSHILHLQNKQLFFGEKDLYLQTMTSKNFWGKDNNDD